MGKIVWLMSTSLDGYMEGPERQIDWHQVDEELHLHLNEYLRAMTGFLSGRVTWDLMAGYWPEADRDPAASEAEKQFAAIWREMPKTVYSRTLPAGPTAHGGIVVNDIVPAEVEKLRANGDVVVGGADTAHAFMALGLIDAVRVYVHPVLIGDGKPMFGPGPRGFAPELLTLRESRTFGNGVVMMHYDLNPGRG